MFIEPHIRSRAENMGTRHDTEIVQELRRRDSAKRPWRVDVRQTDRVVKSVARTAARTTRKWRHVRKCRVGFALSKQEHEAGETRSEFIHDARGNRLAISNGQILGPSEYLAKRRKAGKHLGPCIQRIALSRVLVGLQPSSKQRIPVVERVIHASHVVRTLIACRRIPHIRRRV